MNVKNETDRRTKTLLGRLAHRSELRRGDTFLVVAGRPTRLHEQRAADQNVMSYADLDDFPGWEDNNMVVILAKKDK